MHMGVRPRRPLILGPNNEGDMRTKAKSLLVAVATKLLFVGGKENRREKNR